MRVMLLSRGTGVGLTWGLRETGVELECVDYQESGLISETRRPGSGMVRIDLRLPDGTPRSFQVHESEVAQYRMRHRTSTMNLDVIAKRAEGCDRVLLCKGMFFSLSEIEWLAARVDLTYVLFDTVTCAAPGRIEQHGARGALCRRVIATGAEAVQWFRRHSATRVAQIVQGYRPHVWAPSPRKSRARPVVTFTGGFYLGDGGREKKLGALRAAGIQVRHYAHDSGLVFEKAAREYWDSAVNLNLVPQQDPGSFSNRVVRVLGSGGFLLSERCRDLETMFQDGEELVLFKDTRDMVEKAQDYLADAPARERIAAAGYERSKAFTWDRQAEKYLQFLRDQDVADDGAASCS